RRASQRVVQLDVVRPWNAEGEGYVLVLERANHGIGPGRHRSSPNATMAWARPAPSETREQRARHVRRVAEVGEPDVVHVAPCRALDVLWCHALELAGEVVGGMPVAAVELCARKEVGLLVVGFVVQEILGEELRDD